ncbi:MAG: helix-turn-helix domain-containing protein [Ruminococcaceae bacterium]|nr:helix-turn-helix domain-containing protein [Oscillospiraceae bacterium]
MKCMFESCSLAIAHASENNSFAGYYSESSNPDPNIHMHNCCEIFFCLSGGKNFLIGSQLYEVSDNDIFVINQYEGHKITYLDDTKFRRYVLQISPEFIYGVSSNCTDLGKCFYPHEYGFDHRRQLTKEMAENFKKKIDMLSVDFGYGDDILKRQIMTELLVELNRIFMTSDEASVISSSNTAVRAAIDYINANYSQPLNLESVAKSAYLSVNQLCRLFSKYCGTTVAKYIMSKRISEAKKLLASGKSVTETAMLCGFGDYSVFMRVFKKSVGMTPGKYKSLSE